jgi:hypothetical protein
MTYTQFSYSRSSELEGGERQKNGYNLHESLTPVLRSPEYIPFLEFTFKISLLLTPVLQLPE